MNSSHKIALALLVASTFFIGIVCGALLRDFAVNYEIEKVANNSLENMENLKKACEKEIPRNQECVMLFDFFVVDKQESEDE